MRYLIRQVLLHLCVICSLDCLAAKVLDWYNPFMNFSGQVVWLQYVLYLSVFALMLSQKPHRQKKQVS